MIALLVLLGCSADDPWRLVGVHRGDADAGYGHAVAWHGESLVVGAPFGRVGRVLRADGGEILVGSAGDLLGSGLGGGQGLLVGAPRTSGGGAVLDGDGQVLLEGAGTAPVHHGAGVAAIGAGGVASTSGDGWDADERLWSLVSGDFDGDGTPELVAGRAIGGLVVEGRVHEAPDGTAELGRGLAACDLDDDGRDELLVGVPVPGEVRVYRGGGALDLDAPDAVLSVGYGRAGHAVACDGDRVWIGAPEAHGARGEILRFRGALSSPRPAERITGDRPRSRLGHALAIGVDGRLAASAPGSGEVRILAP